LTPSVGSVQGCRSVNVGAESAIKPLDNEKIRLVTDANGIQVILI